MDDRAKLISILNEINPDLDYETADALVDDGDFSSLEVLTAVMEMESRFHITVDPADVTAEDFNSVDRMLALIEKSRG